ncbi:MAG: serine/threonine-protein kinase [Planctomycetota bacterium]
MVRRPQDEREEDLADASVDDAFAAYLRQCDSGEIPSREDFLKAFPEIADELRELIQAADEIGGLATPDLGAALGLATRHNDMERQPELDTPPRIYAGGDTLSPEKRKTFINQSTGDIDIDENGNAVQGSLRVGSAERADPSMTLPMPGRGKDDPGPSLPYRAGDYELQCILGRGGMGVVYKAYQHSLQRHVAVKMIRSGVLASEAELRRFETEAQAAATLRHPSIVSIYAFGRLDGHPYFSMEWIEGTDLQTLINSGPLDCKRAARIVRDVAWAIDHAHRRGVLHRDLKPANVLLDNGDHVQVTDFGLAKRMDHDSSVTDTGDAVGTPHFMAPEQAIGHSDRCTATTDVYSLGAILFATLTGKPPLYGNTVMETLSKVVHEPAPQVRSLRREVPVDLQTIVAKCLEKKPKRRYESANDMAEELDRFLEGEPILARRRSPVVRMIHWLMGIPLVAVLLGYHNRHPSRGQRQAQAAMLMLALITPIALVASATWYQNHRNVMPKSVTIAGGLEGGSYNTISDWFADRLKDRYPSTQFITTGSRGSLDNFAMLEASQVDVAPMQATAMLGDRLRVVAPLYYEQVHVLAKIDSGIKSVEDLPGHTIAIGPDGSGSRRTAEMILTSLDIPSDISPRRSSAWSEAVSDSAIDVIMICIDDRSDLLHRMVNKGYRHISLSDHIEIALDHPSLQPMTVHDPQFGDLPTVGTSSYLVTTSDAPSELVAQLLDILYTETPPFERISASRAAEWQGLALHPVARQYYESHRSGESEHINSQSATQSRGPTVNITDAGSKR